MLLVLFTRTNVLHSYRMYLNPEGPVYKCRSGDGRREVTFTHHSYIAKNLQSCRYKSDHDTFLRLSFQSVGLSTLCI
jgi:hypothetical protein